MTLNDVYLVSQIAAAIGVVLTLLVLVISIRQNTKAQRTLSVQSITAAITAINIPGMTSPALGNALSGACADWSAARRDDRIIAHYFLFSFFKLCEQAWYQHRSGALDDDQWQGWHNSLLRFYHSPGVKAGWWPNRSVAYSGAFQAYLARSAPPKTTAASSLYELFEGAPAPSPASTDSSSGVR